MPIRPGDRVLFYIDPKRRFVQVIREGGILGTDKGFVRHEEVIGREIGEFVTTSKGVRVHLLRPLPVDFLASMKRATQVIYPKDVSLITYLAGVTEGSRVLEGGVGTGHVTAVLAYLVGDSGKVYAVDIDEAKLRKAAENLERLGLAKRVVFVKRDIREGVDERDFDASILDIPDPWNAVKAVYDSLKSGSPLVAFLPTVNQVEKTVASMQGLFVDIHVYEVLLREYIVSREGTRPSPRMTGHTGYIVFGRKILP